jgi:antitoxin component YwqK of YwqJK toxin-antitoxin module
MKIHLYIYLFFAFISCKSELTKVIERYPDGTVKYLYKFNNKKDVIADSLINGIELAYDSAGKLARKVEYDNGKVSGKQIIYFASGKVWKLFNMRNDSIIGFEYEFNENGDTSTALMHYGFNQNGNFYKKWLGNGKVLSADYGDSSRSFLIWKWSDNGKITRTLIDSGNNEKFTIPE